MLSLIDEAEQQAFSLLYRPREMWFLEQMVSLIWCFSIFIYARQVLNILLF